MNRRGFLGALTGVVASGPKAVAKAATPLGLQDLAIKGIALGAAGGEEGVPATRDTTWAKKNLLSWLNPFRLQERWEEYNVWELHPDLHSLKSVSLTNKMRIQKKRSFAEYKKRSMSFLERTIAGEED